MSAYGASKGYELAWSALEIFSGEAPTDSHDWPDNLIQVEQLEEGTPNENPNSLVTVKTNAGTRYAAGPHGANVCALSETLWGKLAKTKEEAIAAGVEVEEEDEVDSEL